MNKALNEKFINEEYDYDFVLYGENEAAETNEEQITNNEVLLKPRFEVDTLSKADWCFKRIRSLEEEQVKLKEYVKEEKNKYDNFLEKELDRIDKGIEHFKILIQMFVDKETEKDPKFKLKTVNGSASYGKEQTKLEFDDSEMLKYCKDNNLNQFVNVKTEEKLDKANFKKYLQITENGSVITEDGEVMGNIFVNKFRNFNVKINKED